MRVGIDYEQVVPDRHGTVRVGSLELPADGSWARLGELATNLTMARRVQGPWFTAQTLKAEQAPWRLVETLMQFPVTGDSLDLWPDGFGLRLWVSELGPEVLPLFRRAFQYALVRHARRRGVLYLEVGVSIQASLDALVGYLADARRCFELCHEIRQGVSQLVESLARPATDAFLGFHEPARPSAATA